MIYIKNKKDLKEFLEYESKLYERKSTKCPILAIKSKDILYKHNYLLRNAEYYNNVGNKIMTLFYKIKLKLWQNKYNMSIPLNVFDRGLKFIHIGTRIVNDKARVGKNFIMHANTFIVAGGTNKCGYPIIGDNVIMGVNSVISGNVKIGDDVAIGACAFVNKSFENGKMTIAGVPAKKISNNTRKDWNNQID